MTVSVEVADVYVAVEPTGRPVQVTAAYVFVVVPWKKRKFLVPDVNVPLKETESVVAVKYAVGVIDPNEAFRTCKVPALIVVDPV